MLVKQPDCFVNSVVDGQMRFGADGLFGASRLSDDGGALIDVACLRVLQLCQLNKKKKKLE